MTDDRPQQPDVEAGWYADPGGQPLLRYWDGEKFTNATAPAGAAAAETLSSDSGQQPQEATQEPSLPLAGTGEGGGSPGWLMPVVVGLSFFVVAQYLTTDHAFRNMPIPVLEFSSTVQITNPCRAAYIRGLHELDQVYASALAGEERAPEQLEGLEALAEMCDLPAPELDQLFE